MSDDSLADQSASRPGGLLGFSIVWFGQLISNLGSTMTWFALTVWAWQLTGQATALALVGFFSFAPSILISPIAGALVDRWNRKLVMMLSDLAAGLSTIGVLALYATGNLEIWHLYVTGAFASVFQAFQWPAYSAAIATMLPKKHYARANGMLSMVESASNILAPALAGMLLLAVGIAGVMVVDIVTFVAAIGTIIFVRIPSPRPSADGAEGKGSLLKESLYGFRYIRARPSLLGLQLVFLCVNVASTLGLTILAAMTLARSGSNPSVLGLVQAASGFGGLCGGLLLSIWGGPKRRIHGVLLGMIGAGLLGQMVMALGRTSLVWAAGSFCFMLIVPILNGANQAIWQSKVAPDIQGRVFAVRRMIAQIAMPLATLLAGPLVDYILEPGMQAQGALHRVFGPLVGTGAGAGMAVLMFFCGVLSVGAGVAGYAIPLVRNVERLVPDHDYNPAAPHEPAPTPTLSDDLQLVAE
jgi:MFS transporter, DHA3 family, macrolide efflux protein